MRVDFYILTDPSPGAPETLACRLAEKAWLMGHRVYLATGSREQAGRLDDLLWTFRQDSFVPHGLYPDRWSPEDPILVGVGEAPADFDQVLVNLAGDLLPFRERFSRVAEVVAGDPAALQAGRERYRAYREAGAELHKHDV